MTYKNKAFRRAAAAAAAICLAFAFAFAEETGADRLGFGTSITVSADDLEYNIGTAKITYTTDANGNVTITKFDEGDETSIQIPETIDGGKVKTIGANAFADCSSLTSITLPQSLTNIENLAFARCTALQNINIPQDVTNIGVSAFLRCKSLTNITIPSGVTSIKTSAFALCTSIKSIELPDHLVSIGNSAFTGCYSLESVVIPSVVTSVGEFAFSYCTSLASITLPPSVTSIEDDAFQGCTSLETAFFPRSATLGTGSFPLNTAQIRYTKDSSTGDVMIDRVQTSESSRTSIEIPETICGGTVTTLCPYSFDNCGILEKIKLPKTLTLIDRFAFRYCTSLKEIEIFQNVSVIGGDAFLNCTSLKTVYLPEGLSGSAIQDNAARIYYSYRPAEAKTSIVNVEAGDQTDIVIPETISGGKVDAIKKAAFINNAKLKSVTLPNGLVSIGDEAFVNCTVLTGITIPDSVENIGIYAFDNCTSLVSAKLPDNEDLFIGGDAFSGCSSLESIVIPDGVTTIETGLFYKCEKLESITLPDSIISIGDNAFCGCEKLVSINFPADLGTIGEDAFYNCTSLASVDLPSKLTVIGQEAFLGCERLTSVTIPDSVTELGAGAFECCYNLADVTLPKGLRVLRSFVLRWTAIKSIVIPETVTQINDCAFYKCSVLESIELPPNVSYMGDMVFEDCPALKNVFYNTGTDVSDSKIPETSAKTKYEIRNNYAYILEIIPDSSNTPVVIPDTICGYEVMSTAEEYRQYVSETGHTHKGGTATCTEKALCDICGNSYDSTDLTNHNADTSTWKYNENGHWNPCLRAGCEAHLNTAAHTFDDGVITTKPTEKTEGVKTYTCTVCGYEKTESIEKLPPKPAKVIYPITISGDVTADRSSAAAGETVTVSAPFGYDIIVTDINGRQIAKFSEKGSFEMPSSRVSITAVRGETFAHMSNAWNHSYVYSYDSDMNRIKVNSDTKRGMITIDLGADHAGRSFTIYSGRKSTSKKIISGTLDENGRYTFNADEGRNYTLVIK